MRGINVGVVALLVAVPAAALAGSLGIDLSRGHGLFSGALPPLQQSLSLSYDSRFGSSALWWGSVPLRPRPNLEIDLVLGAQVDAFDAPSWLPGVRLTWRPSEHFELRAQWMTVAARQRWPWVGAGSGSHGGYRRWREASFPQHD
jgi:hypothetical protein